MKNGRADNNRRISEEKARKVWALQKKGFSTGEICDILDTSATTTRRVTAIFTAVETGDASKMYGYADTSNRILNLAEAFFGKKLYVDEKIDVCAEDQEKSKTDKFPDNTIGYLVAVLVELRRNNELLESIAEAFKK